jgi:hypothetical protein
MDIAVRVRNIKILRDVPAEIIVLAARTAHEVNRAYCAGLGDTSQVAWEDAPVWQRDSAVDGVFGVLNGNTPEESHELWMRAKIADGWVYGPTKDADAKTHPCLVPYDQVPEPQRLKDALFVFAVRGVLLADGAASSFLKRDPATPPR